MQQIQIDFDVYKALTARRESERHSYNDVLRQILELDSVVEPDLSEPSTKLEDGRVARAAHGFPTDSGFFSRGLWLPNGTKLRARYKQREHTAEILNSRWVDSSGKAQTSPSAAATQITGTNVNGLRFWEAMRPTDAGWRRLDALTPYHG